MGRKDIGKAKRKKIAGILSVDIEDRHLTRLMAGPLDELAFQNAIALRDPDEDDQSNIWVTRDFFRNKLQRMSAKRSLQILEVVLSRFRFVQILADARSNPQEIFETLNHDGIPLSQVDLVRNYLFMTAGAYADRVYKSHWVKTEEKLPEGLLRRYLLSWCLFEAAVQPRSHVSPTENTLYVSFKSLVAPRLGSTTAAQRTIEVICDESAPFSHFMLPGKIEVSGQTPRRIKYLLSELRSFKSTGPADPVLYQLQYCWEHGSLDDLTYLRALRRIEAFLVRWVLVGNNQSALTSYFRILSLSGDLVSGGLDPDRVLTAYFRHAPLGLAPDLVAIRKSFNERDFYKSDSQHKYIFRRLIQCRQQRIGISSFMHQPFDPQTAESTEVPNNWTIDHIMPQDLKYWIPDLKRWGVDEDQAAQMVNRIGNLALLPRPTNSAVQNFPWDRPATSGQGRRKGDPVSKRDWYGSVAKAFHTDIRRIARFDLNAISRRGDRLAELADQIWPNPTQAKM